MTEDFYIESNLNEKEIQKAFKAGNKKIKFNFEEEVCAEYEDRTISIESFEKLTKLGYVLPESEFGDEPDDEWVYLEIEQYVHMWLFVAKLGNKKFEYSLVKSDTPVIEIGGYGLFYL
jgi:hypothetical protein